MRPPLGLGLGLLLLSGGAYGHEDDRERLRLRPAPERGELTGQLSQSPHRVAQRETLTREQLAERVLKDAEGALHIELDARPCVPRMQIRELWEPGGATAGDLVTFSCPLESSARTLRLVSREARLLEVTVELGQTEPARPLALVGANDGLSVQLREPKPESYRSLGALLLLGALLTAAGYSRAPRSPGSTR